MNRSRETGRGAQFDWFVLSDTTDPAIWIAEEKCFLAAARERSASAPDLLPAPSGKHRAQVRQYRRLGHAVRRRLRPHDLILDADSLMTGDTIVRLVARDGSSIPMSALIQTLPIVVNARTLFARVQQFAGRLYGPLIAQGIAWWHGAEGNYWGHNAIIRVARLCASMPGCPNWRAASRSAAISSATTSSRRR